MKSFSDDQTICLMILNKSSDILQNHQQCLIWADIFSWTQDIYFVTISCICTMMVTSVHRRFVIPPRPTKLEGGILDSPCLSVCPSVCRRHGFRSISQVCFGISISNFICMLMVAIGRSLLIFSNVTFKMAAWRPYWIFWFPDSNFTLALNINFKLQRHNTYVYG